MLSCNTQPYFLRPGSQSQSDAPLSNISRSSVSMLSCVMLSCVIQPYHHGPGRRSLGVTPLASYFALSSSHSLGHYAAMFSPLWDFQPGWCTDGSTFYTRQLPCYCVLCSHNIFVLAVAAWALQRWLDIPHSSIPTLLCIMRPVHHRPGCRCLGVAPKT